jgi:hypothetical protein
MIPLASTKPIAVCLHAPHMRNNAAMIEECTLRFLRLGTDSASGPMPRLKGISTARYSSDGAIDTMLMSGRSSPRSSSSSHGSTLRRCSWLLAVSRTTDRLVSRRLLLASNSACRAGSVRRVRTDSYVRVWSHSCMTAWEETRPQRRAHMFTSNTFHDDSLTYEPPGAKWNSSSRM